MRKITFYINDSYNMLKIKIIKCTKIKALGGKIYKNKTCMINFIK